MGERPPPQPLPTPEEIDAIDSIETLQEIRQRVLEARERIEVDLEFRTDDRADADWERRARGALTAHRIVLGHIGKRLARLGKPQPLDPEQKVSKAVAGAAKHQLLLDQERERTERKRIESEQQIILSRIAAQARVEKEREKTRRHLADTALRLNYLGAFHHVAYARLTPELYRQLMEEAEQRAQQLFGEMAGTHKEEAA